MNTETPDQWNARYAEGNTPWDTNYPDRELARVMGEYKIAPCRMLELGCGTGTNALWLAAQDFDVTALDLSQLAVDKAQAKAAEAGASVKFFQADVFNLPELDEPFPFVFDRGVYHCVRRLDAQRFAAVVADLTAPGGMYLTLAGNPNEPHAAEGGPPRVAAEELCRELSPHFHLVQLREYRFDPVTIEGTTMEPLAWSALWRRKAND